MATQRPWRGPLVVLTAAHAIGTVNFTTVLAMAPAVQAGVGLSRTEFGLLAGAYFAALLGCAIPFGWVVDRVGVRRALIGAHLVMAMGTALLTQARGLPAAAVCAGLSGVGYAFINPATAKGVLLRVPADQRGAAMGIKQTGVPVGGALAAAAAAGALALDLGWQVILWMVAGVTAASAGLYGLSFGDDGGEGRAGGIRGGIADLVGVLRDRNLGLFIATGALFSGVQAAFLTYLTLFVEHATQAGLPFASLCLGVAHVGGAIGRIGWGVASDRLFRGGRKTSLVIMGACGTALLVLMLAVGPGWGGAVAALLAFLLGLAITSHAGLYQAGAAEAVDARVAGAAIGYSMTAVPLGSMLGPPVFGRVVDRTGWFGSGWLLLAGVLLTSTVMLAALFRERRANG